MIKSYSELVTELMVIANETGQGANTKTRIAQMFQDCVDSTVLVAKKTLTSSQILALQGTPIELIPAPGASKMIAVNSIAGLMKPGNNSYQGGGTIILILNNVSTNSGLTPLMTTATKDYLHISPKVIGGNTSNYDNQPLKLGAGTNWTTGNGTMDIYVYYKIIDLS